MIPQIFYRALSGKKWANSTAVLEAAVEAEAVRYANGVVARLRPYPPEPEGSTYDRTGILGESWQVVPSRGVSSLRVHIGNPAKDIRGRFYAQWVVGNHQTAQHRNTGWKRIDDPTVLARPLFRAMMLKVYKDFAAATNRGR